MNKKIFKILLTLVVLIAVVSLGFKGTDDKNKMNKPTVNDNYNYIAVNQILMYVSNNGDGSHDPKTDGNGFYWPGGLQATKSAIFEDGFIYGSRIGNEIRVNGNTHRQGLQAGKILSNGKADDPSLAKYRVYKVRKDWRTYPAGPTRDALEKDWFEWPVEDGAPWIDVNNNQKYDPEVDSPDIMGDEMLWYVANDLDASRTTFTYGTNPQGLEFQTSVFGFNRTGPLGNMVFKKYLFINKGTNILNDMIIAYWSDPDLGFANDDYAGCDTTLKLGYVYNATNDDQIYGAPCPAVGYVFFQGPKIPYDKVQYPIIIQKNLPDSAKFLGKWYKNQTNLPMTAFTAYINGNASYSDPDQGVASGSIEFYNYLSGYVWNGNPFIDPHTGQPVKFALAGDPVKGTGWYEGPGWPGGPVPYDRRIVMASGPFRMAPGDTQEVVVGIVIARGATNLGSVTELKNSAKLAQLAFDVDFNLPQAPPAPIMHAYAQNEAVTLWWEPNAENFAVKNTIISPDAPDKFYRFQGYRIWQFKDATGADPKLLAVVDIKDNITEVNEEVDVNGVKVVAPAFKLPNEGLQRSITINKNIYTNGPLYNGSPYYFAVTSFAVNKYSIPSSPEYLERPPAPIEVLPTTPKIDITYPYNNGKEIVLNQTGGTGTGKVSFVVVDPEALTGHEYIVKFNGKDDNLNYHIIDKTTNDTIVKASKEFNTDASRSLVFHGLALKINNIGKDTLRIIDSIYKSKSAIKEILEVKGPNGKVLDKPIDVLNNLNSTNKWRIYGYGQPKTNPAKDHRQNINWRQAAELNDYEIRFTATGSQYYCTGYDLLTPEFKANFKGKNTVPFEIWMDSAATGKWKRMYIKVYDFKKDSVWTKLDTNNSYEEILAYVSKTPYPDNGVILDKSETTVGTDHKFGFLRFTGDMPEAGTVIKINTWKPLQQGDQFETKVEKTNFSDKEAAKNKLDEVSVFPNPYFGANALERDKYQRFVRFTNLPKEVDVKIFNLSGLFIRQIKKDSDIPWLDWDLRTKDGLPIASGVYIAYLDMPGIGKKILKIAVIMETQYIDRL